MHKHTPGPWTAESVFGSRDGAWAIRKPGTINNSAEGLAVITGRSLVHDRTDEIVEANARLIAAAPDLFEACKSALVRLVEMNRQPDTQDALRAAIAKAEGRKP